MRTIPASIAAGTFAGVTRGDREAFHHLFDDYAPSPAESAGQETHGDAAAAHVIEHLFEQAWQQRHDFVSPDQRAIVKLDDGTTVMMGADANVTVPKAFNHTLRAVKLVGSARFTVAANAKIPFIVRAGKLQVVATGTEFTVSAYEHEPVVVTVQQGSVKVTAGKDERDVAKGTSLALSADGVLFVPTAEVRDEATSWADGRVVIANRTVRSSLPVFRRWYQYDLRPETQLLDRPVSLSAPIASGDSALAELERVAHVKQIWIQKNMVLVDAVAGAAPTK